MMGCKTEVKPEIILANAKAKIQGAKTFNYNYQGEFNTLMNNRIHKDSTNIIFSKEEDSFHGFGFYAENKYGEYIFDGQNYQEVDHEEKLIISYPKEDIKNDSTYFQIRGFMTNTPLELMKVSEFNRVIDTVFHQQEYFVFEKITAPKSVVDESRKIKKIERYFIEKDKEIYNHLEVITIFNGDTAQIANIDFTDLQLKKIPFEFGEIDKSNFIKYKEINSNDLENDNCENLISVGEKVEKKFYTDINETSICLFGEPNKSSVIMFSFIGCGGCEYALSEIEKKNFQFKENINFYYNSHFDNNKTMQAYLEKRNYQFNLFSKESQMNDEFSVCHFPTFVELNEKGIVIKVISGYDTEVENMIF